ncbi:hypothetical protein BO83DRAFT_423020 [Aspergillus eucalypticola CBS 122712]|uniref:Carboxymuconolactone decarboxylase-like domain-containing protein n=1 Tax=Aspergillus eucalypticola (strain CBS 122712 / IBT 29274) TaxID=1448314 RepID=A0A317WGJ4_ASPEC|nr:uncharacterized protein BO83DRAFT_423020 [Aspergillus eucalypticola CBS 122712]PWY84382.1 hypothetical protein BO83DRAFT_423020 [Aspergillus eucalypticola CBS 122712]
MSDFAAKFTNANIATGAAAYDSTRALAWIERVHQLEPATHNGFAVALLSTMLCAQRRGDTVSVLFRDATKNEAEAFVKETFIIVREALAIIVPFVGFPSCMPAVFGLVGELRSRGISQVPSQERLGFDKVDYTAEGRASFKRVYRGVGNSEVGQMLQQYFPEYVFGYLLSGNNLLKLKEKELVLASGIFAQGATRQSQSHCKASIQLGNSVDVVKGLFDVSADVALWNNNPLPAEIDVIQLAEEVKRNLAAENQ